MPRLDLVRIGLWLALGFVVCVTLYIVFDRQRAETEAALRDKLEREAEDNRTIAALENAVRDISNDRPQQSAGPPTPEPTVTKAEYDQIGHGMSYREVMRIIGAEGDETASGYSEGVPGVMKSVTTKSYIWSNDVESGGGTMTVMFQNDKVITKVQLGLK